MESSFEKPPQIAPRLEPQPEQVSDEHWYTRFKELSVEPLELLEGDKELREAQKAKFLTGEIRNPALDYPKLNAEELTRRDRELLALRREIRQREPNEVVSQAWRWKINEHLAEIRMLQATAEGDGDKFTAYSRFAHGEPSKDILALTVYTVRARLQPHLTSDNPEMQNTARELDEVLPQNLPQPTITFLPDEKTIQHAREQTQHEFGDIIAVPKEVDRVNAQQIKEAFEYALQGIKAPKEWQVVLDTGSRLSIMVSGKQRKVFIPVERQQTVDKLRGLIVHEIGTHVDRKERGERSKLKLLGIGLDRYLPGEEGIATMREDVTRSSVQEFGKPDRHLAIGLALGIDGKKRDFRDVYEMMVPYYKFQALERGKDAQAAQAEAKEEAWTRAVRTFRGTDCKTPGAAYTKDIVYHEGTIGVWGVIRDKPEEMIWFNVGKYDPTNNRHTWILERLGIKDKDLAALERSKEKQT